MWIESPDAPQLDELCQQLADRATELDVGEVDWPAEQLSLCAESGVFRWFIPQSWGGADWSQADLIRGYIKLASGCLTTTFIITQYAAACRRIAAFDNVSMQAELLPKLAQGELFATVGISHLTTSRRHVKQPVLRAEVVDGGFRLDGMAPWVTGGPHADIVVVGASLADGSQILAAVPMDLPGIGVRPSSDLVGLSASQTGAIDFEQCSITQEHLLAGPVQDVMKQGAGVSTGGVQTSSLAVGLAKAAVDYMLDEATRRPELCEAANALSDELADLTRNVLATASGEFVCSNEELRTRANSLALRSSQASLTAAKGTGYLIGHSAGRWCREALFFLVWSCPQPVMNANLCELAQI